MAARTLLLGLSPLLFLLGACGSGADATDKGAGSDACGYDADFCAAAGKNCGSFGLVDKCGATRTVQCGDCRSPQSCGGGGSANVCGATCDQGCPASFSCNDSGICAGGAPHGIALDIKTVPLSGRVTLDGAPLGVGAYCTNSPTSAKARLNFEDPTSGASFGADVMCDATDTFTLSIEPGTYRVSIGSGYSDASNLPDGSFVIDPAFVVKGPTTGAALDVKTAVVSGTLTLNGAPLTTGSYCVSSPTSTKATINLVEVTTGASFSAPVLCNDPGGAFSVRVGAGSYRATVGSAYESASNLPSGTFGVATPIVAGGAPATIALGTTAITGKLTLNGGPLGIGSYCKSSPSEAKVQLSFLDLDSGSSFSAQVLCSSTDDSFSTILTPGKYRVSASSGYSNASNLPDGSFVVADSFVVTPTTAPAAFDAKTVVATGKVTMNGGALVPHSYCINSPTESMVSLTFVETTTRASFSSKVLCNSLDGSFAVTLAPGTYAVGASSGYTDASTFPDGYFVLSSALAVPGGPVALDLKTVAVDGRLTLNGGALGVGTYCANSTTSDKVRLTFIDASSAPTFSIWDEWKAPPATSVSAVIPCSAADAFTTLLAPGVYRVHASSAYSSASNLPDGYFTSVGRIDLH